MKKFSLRRCLGDYTSEMKEDRFQKTHTIAWKCKNAKKTLQRNKNPLFGFGGEKSWSNEGYPHMPTVPKGLRSATKESATSQGHLVHRCNSRCMDFWWHILVTNIGWTTFRGNLLWLLQRTFVSKQASTSLLSIHSDEADKERLGFSNLTAVRLPTAVGPTIYR